MQSLNDAMITMYIGNVKQKINFLAPLRSFAEPHGTYSRFLEVV